MYRTSEKVSVCADFAEEMILFYKNQRKISNFVMCLLNFISLSFYIKDYLSFKKKLVSL